MRYLYWTLTALAALVAADFAVSNRAAVVLQLWPLPDAIAVRLYLVVLAMLGLGLLAGLGLGWAVHLGIRRDRRRNARRIRALEAELARSRVETAAPQQRSEGRSLVA